MDEELETSAPPLSRPLRRTASLSAKMLFYASSTIADLLPGGGFDLIRQAGQKAHALHVLR